MMEKNIRENGYHVHADRDADNIKRCIVLLDRIMDDEYDTKSLKRHDEKWGEANVGFTKDG